MSEILTFHFEGALADAHRMNFYESARFQYAAARLLVKLSQFRQHGRFVQKITAKSNFDIQLTSQTDGSFNINVEDPGQSPTDEPFVSLSLADLVAYVSERVVEKIDETTLNSSREPDAARSTDNPGETDIPISAIDTLADEVILGRLDPDTIQATIRDLVKRRVAEAHREERLDSSKPAIARIDFARSQKLIAMAAPLVSEMATALRKSANTLEVISSSHGKSRPVLFLDREMAQEIETSAVDSEITPILGDITQFNKDNGWGKLKIENGMKTVSFSIPYDILPDIRSSLINSMNRDLVYLQTYFVKDRAGELIRLIAVGILPTPTS